jgi:hypothetical protein
MNRRRPPTSARTAVLLGLMFGAACRQQEQSAAEQVATWSLQPLFIVGDSAPRELNRVSSLLWLSDGRLLVADVGSRSLLLVDSAGRTMTQLGREGSGPGEYRSPNSLASLGDTIVLHDPANARLGLFLADGRWVQNLVVPPITGPEIRLYRVPGREFCAVGFQTTDKTKAGLTFIRYDASGPRDTLFRPSAPESPTVAAMCRGSDKGLHFYSVPWGATYIEHPGPDRTILSAVTSAYDIVARTVAGDTVARFRGTRETNTITEAEWDSATADFREYLSRDPATQCNTRTLTRPTVKPFVRTFFWSDDSELWVERYDSAGFSFDVFDKGGRQIAKVKAPERIEDVEPHVMLNRIVLLAPGADGSHIVRAFRIVRPR